MMSGQISRLWPRGVLLHATTSEMFWRAACRKTAGWLRRSSLAADGMRLTNVSCLEA